MKAHTSLVTCTRRKKANGAKGNQVQAPDGKNCSSKTGREASLHPMINTEFIQYTHKIGKILNKLITKNKYLSVESTTVP